MNRKLIAIMLVWTAAVVSVTLFGCFYDLDGERHPTDPDRTGVQGWSLYVTVTPATSPANGTSMMSVQARFWDLENRNGIAGEDVFFTIYEASGNPANPAEVSFQDGGITTQLPTNAQGLANVTMYAHYIPKIVIEKQYYVRAEATVDFDNNALNFWDIHYFRLYNPYYDGKPTPMPGDEGTPTAEFTFFPSKTTTCEPITFDASFSYDTDATGGKAYDQIVSYNWYFGDGSSASGKIVTHQYEEDGSYTVDLIIYDDEGFPGTTNDTVSISGCN